MLILIKRWLWILFRYKLNENSSLMNSQINWYGKGIMINKLIRLNTPSEYNIFSISKLFSMHSIAMVNGDDDVRKT